MAMLILFLDNGTL